jgi:hypothetical protein
VPFYFSEKKKKKRHTEPLVYVKWEKRKAAGF